MINIAFRLLLCFNATSLLVIIFLVQKGHALGYFLANAGCLSWLSTLPNAVSYILYLLVPLLSTGLSILLSSRLGRDAFKQGEVANIEHANNSFLPSYLGYFFVALSIGNWETLVFVYAVLFTFTFLSQALYFNPLLLIFGCSHRPSRSARPMRQPHRAKAVEYSEAAIVPLRRLRPGEARSAYRFSVPLMRLVVLIANIRCLGVSGFPN
jgi:hypothetical protein